MENIEIFDILVSHIYQLQKYPQSTRRFEVPHEDYILEILRYNCATFGIDIYKKDDEQRKNHSFFVEEKQLINSYNNIPIYLIHHSYNLNRIDYDKFHISISKPNITYKCRYCGIVTFPNITKHKKHLQTKKHSNSLRKIEKIILDNTPLNEDISREIMSYII